MELGAIYSLEIETLWELFRGEIKEAIGNEKDLKKKKDMLKVLEAVKEGENKDMRIDLRLILAREYKECLKQGKVEVNRKMFDLYRFFDEVENRKSTLNCTKNYTHRQNHQES